MLWILEKMLRGPSCSAVQFGKRSGQRPFVLTRSFRQSGMALVVVLWLLAALSLIATRVFEIQRNDSRESYTEMRRSKALLAAEGGISIAVHRWLSPTDRVGTNENAYPLVLNDVKLTISVRSEHGKLDLNFASLDYFARLFLAMGANRYEADRLVSQMRERREQGQALQQFEDLLEATAIDTDLYQRILPYVTLWGRDRVPLAAYADRALIQSINLPEAQLQSSGGDSVIGIDVQATLTDGFTGGLRATVLLMPAGSSTDVFRILHWQER